MSQFNYNSLVTLPSVELGDKFKRPVNLPSYTEKIKTPCGNFYLTYSIALCKGRVKLVELFASTGSLEREGALCAGGLLMTCKLISKTLQRGVDHKRVADDVKGNPCPRTSEAGLLTCPIVIWKGLKDFPQEKLEMALFKQEVNHNVLEGGDEQTQ